MRLREGLDQAATGALRRIAAAHDLSVDDATTRGELLDLLERHLLDPATLAAEVESLEPAELAALLAARGAGGEIRGFLLARCLESADPEAARPLMERGFLFRTFAPLGPHRGEVYAVPEEVLALLPAGEGVGGAAGPPSPVDPPVRERRRSTEPAFSVFALASFLQRHPGGEGDLGASARAAALKEETASWAEEPGGWEWQERWAFLEHLGLAAGLFERRPDGGRDLTARLRRLLADRPALGERLRAAYRAEHDWPDVVHADAAGADLIAEQIDPPSTRGALIAALGRLEPGAWYAVAALSEWLARTIPSFLREQLDARGLAAVDPASGTQLWGDDAWERVEARLIRYLLLGPLYWLGAVAADATGEVIALTPAGASLITPTALSESRPPEPCTWEGTQHLVAPARADLSALLEAERYLALASRGQVSRYRLDRSRLAAALDAGGSIADLRQALTRLSSGTLPIGVERHLSDWEREYGALSFRPAVVLEARDPADLDAALAVDGVRPFARKRLGPAAVEVPASHVAEIAAALRSSGRLPHVDAALRLMAGRRAYISLVDEHVLEFLLVSLLALRQARPERLAGLEGALALVDRLEELFPREQLTSLREAASVLAGELAAAPAPRRRRKDGRRRRG